MTLERLADHDGAHQIGYLCRGHVDLAAFMQAALDQSAFDEPNAKEPRHVWVIEEDGELTEVGEGAIGSFKATIINGF